MGKSGQTTQVPSEQREEASWTVLDCLDANVAMLNAKGFIVAANAPWRAFAHANGLHQDFVGDNYLTVCDRAEGAASEQAPLAAAGIRDVLAGHSEEFKMDYPCHSPYEKRWFRLRAAPIKCNKWHALVFHRNITRAVLAERDANETRHRLAAARDEHYRRVSRELHDTIGQKLLVMQMAARHLGHQQKKLDSSVEQALSTIGKISHDMIEDIHRLSRLLYPPALEELGLAAALRQMIRDVHPVAHVDFRSEPGLSNVRFRSDVEVAVFRVAQEALANALRHSRASHISLKLKKHDGQLLLTVLDNGLGFDPAHVSGGLGLHHMHERASAVLGELHIKSKRGQTRVALQVPAVLSS